MGPKWEHWSDPAKVGLISLPIFLASQGAWAACANTITVLDGSGASQVFCRGTDGTNYESALTLMDPAGGNFAAVNALSQLLVSTGAIAVSSVPNPVTVTGTVTATVPNPTTVVGTVTANIPNPVTVTGTVVATIPNPTTVTVASLTVGTMPNPTTVAGTITVNNSPLISSISNWSGLPNPVSVTLVSGLPNPVTVTGTVAISNFPNPLTVTGTFTASSNVWLINSAGTQIATAANPVSTVGTVTVNNSPLISSISNWSGFPNPATVTGTLIQQDATAFTPTTTSFGVGGGFFQTTPTNNTLANLQMGGFQVTNSRALFTNLRNSAATEIGTAANPVSTVGTVTVNNASLTVSVSNIATTVTVSNNPLIASISNNITALSVQGVASNAATAVGGPVQIGGVAQVAEPTATTTGQATAALWTVTGKQVMEPWSLPESRAYGSVSTGSTTAVTVIAAPGASVRLYGWVECGRTDAGTSAVTITLNDTAGTVFVLPNTSGGGGNNMMPPIPFQWGANSPVTIAVSAATTTVFCSAQAYKSAI
jgi:hypothetical protein